MKHLTFATDSKIKISQRGLSALPIVDRAKLDECLIQLSILTNNLYKNDSEINTELPKVKNFSVDNEYLMTHSVDDQLHYALP